VRGTNEFHLGLAAFSHCERIGGLKTSICVLDGKKGLVGSFGLAIFLCGEGNFEVVGGTQGDGLRKGFLRVQSKRGEEDQQMYIYSD
jgi:hypothetical protein